MAFRLLIRTAGLVLAGLVLQGCSNLGRSPATLLGYQPEAFDATTHVRHYLGTPARTCEAARRALLSQGYVVTAAAEDGVTARKYFQPDAEHHVQLEFRVVCAPEGVRPVSSVAFASGLKEQYIVRKAKESASLGVGGIGSLSLPVEGSMDSMVKVASETITEAGVYDRLFTLMASFFDAIDTEPAASAQALAEERPGPGEAPCAAGRAEAGPAS